MALRFPEGSGSDDLKPVVLEAASLSEMFSPAREETIFEALNPKPCFLPRLALEFVDRLAGRGLRSARRFTD